MQHDPHSFRKPRNRWRGLQRVLLGGPAQQKYADRVGNRPVLSRLDYWRSETVLQRNISLLVSRPGAATIEGMR
jgi:hypothetical protein